MFGKKIIREFLQYLRKLWPYALALAVMGAFTRVIIMLDNNPIEATGTASAIGLFVMTALLCAIRGFAHACSSFSKNLSLEKSENVHNLKQFLWAQIIAFMIYVIFAALIFLACVSIITWDYTGRLLSVFDTDWYYYIELSFYIVVVTATIYIISITRIVTSRFRKRKKLSLFIGIITFFMCFISITTESLLLANSPSTDILSVWLTTMIILAVFILVDVCMYSLAYHTLKAEFSKKQNETIK